MSESEKQKKTSDWLTVALALLAAGVIIAVVFSFRGEPAAATAPAPIKPPKKLPETAAAS